MKVLGLNGSPRNNGNTIKMIQNMLNSAESEGIETELIEIGKLDFQGCQGCYGCSKTFKCVLKDDMEKIYHSIDESDEIIFASPVYMWQMSSQLKKVIDRLMPYYMKNHKQGDLQKKSILLFSQEDNNREANREYFKIVEKGMDFIGFKHKKTYVAGGTLAFDDVEKDKFLIDELLESYSK